MHWTAISEQQWPCWINNRASDPKHGFLCFLGRSIIFATAETGGEAQCPYLLYDIQQAAEVMGIATLSQVHQQLGGQFANLVVFIFWDMRQLGDDQINQFLLQSKTISDYN